VIGPLTSRIVLVCVEVSVHLPVSGHVRNGRIGCVKLDVLVCCDLQVLATEGQRIIGAGGYI
jgi:hypothetical protein